MTLAADGSDQTRQARNIGETLTAFLTWPVFTLLFLLLPFLATLEVANKKDAELDEALKTVADWITPIAADSSFDTAPGFAHIAIVSAIVLGLAFLLPPGGANKLSASDFRILAGISVGVVLSVIVLSVVVVWNMIAGRTSFDMFLLLAGAWFVTLLTALINFKRPAVDLLQEAKLEWEKHKLAAEEIGISTQVPIVLYGAWRSKVVFWALPLVALVLPLAGLLLDFWGRDTQDEALAGCILLVGAVALMQLGWYVTAAYPPHSAADKFTAWLFRGAGLLLMMIVVFTAGAAGSWMFFILSAAVSLVLALFLCVPELAERLSFIRDIRRSATVKRLKQIHEWYTKKQDAYDIESGAS